jgi:hypothetical protein
MKISVVVPTFNRADLLPPTLDAILAQTLPASEVIVVDDGSRDTTPEVLARYSGRIHAIRIENSGDLVARNVGLRAASSEVVAFCDSDDLWKREFLMAIDAAWRAAPALRAVYTDFQIVRDDVWEPETKFSTAPQGFWGGMRRITENLGVFSESMVERLIGFQPLFPSCMTVNRSYFLSLGGWDESVSAFVSGDFATALRVGENPPIGIISQSLVGIRKHSGNFSGDVQRTCLGEADVLERVLDQRPSLRPHQQLIQASIARRRRDAIGIAFSRNDFSAVRKTYAMLPEAERSRQLSIKNAVSGLPAGPRGALAAALLAMGSWRSGQRPLSFL